MNRADLVRAIVACEAAAKEFRAALAADVEREFEVQGVKPKGWDLPGVTVSWPVKHPFVEVVDEPKFRAWVAERYPHQIETLVRVFPAFQSKLLAEAAWRGDPPHNDDGEVIPGLAYSPGGASKSLTITATPDLKSQLTAAAREMVAGSRPLALPGVDG